jgi:transposase-like protein
MTPAESARQSNAAVAKHWNSGSGPEISKRRISPRDMEIYAAYLANGKSVRSLARAMGIWPQAIYRVIHKVEDARSPE